MAGINYQLRLLVVMMMMMKLLLLLLQGWGSTACFVEERAALLQLKASFSCPNCSLSKEMLTWRKDFDCCMWDGVGCNPTTGRVYQLMLDDFRQEDSGNWYFNASMFLPFQELRWLSLRNNYIICCLQDEDFKRLSSTINLEYLDLSSNELGNTILPFVAGFSTLKSLYINEIGLIRTRGIEELRKLKNLEILDLGNNDLNNILPLLHGIHSLKTLDMSSTQQKGSINIKELIALYNLEELKLGGNNIDKFVVHKDIEVLSNISILWLDYGVFNGSSFELESLKVFPKLESLHLEYNNFIGVLFSEGLDNVKELYLDGSYLDENFVQSLGGLCFLRNLSMQNIQTNNPTLLSLSDSNTLLESIANMTSLEALSLSGSELTGNIHGTTGFCKLTNLRELDLFSNNLSGNLPHCLVNLTLLQNLKLSFNHFSGKISQSPLKFLTSLASLALVNNQFEISSSLSSFFNHSKLKNFTADGNEVYAETGVVNHNLIPKFQFEILSLKSTSRGGSFPEFLYHQHDLQYLLLPGIPMVGLGFPGWLLENNTNLEILYLSNCYLSGPLDFLARNPNATLRELDISTNQLDGRIPTEIGTYFPMLEGLMLSENEFTGSIPRSLSNCSKLKIFTASDNKLVSEVPRWIETMNSLELLDLSNNNLFGSLPTMLGSPLLIHILLSGNRLEGHFPRSVSDHVQTLDLSNNCLTGVIPQWIGKLYELILLLLSHNNFSGEIPIDLWMMTNQLMLVDLSHNNLSAPFVNHSHNYKGTTKDVRYAYAYSMDGGFEFVVKGNIFGYTVGQIVSMGFIGLDLSCNNLTGQVPLEFGSIPDINLLNLSHNRLTGSIPFSFSNMTKIETLDLSNNDLSGIIPLQLTELKFLEVFNVSYNNLSGKTPEKIAQFATFDESSYKGNPFLCGFPLPKSCSPEEPAPPSSITKENSDDDKVDGGFVDINVFYISFSVSFTIILVTMFVILYINPYWRQIWFFFIERIINNCYYYFR